jgi:protein ImuB
VSEVLKNGRINPALQADVVGRDLSRRTFLVPVSSAAGTETAAAPRARQLWLCVQLPRLAVDVLPGDPGAPLAATETAGGRVAIAACNGAAERRGVRAGMTLAAALPLCGGLATLPRDPSAECRKLNEFAAAACRLSGAVSLHSQDGVVLEIGGSLQLFGGLAGILRKAREEFAALRARFVFGIAATARAAGWLARHQPGRYALFPEELPAVLRPLPVAALTREEKTLRQLERSGVRTIGALLRLPRDGVARRFGPEILEALDAALGRAPEALPLFSPPQPFAAEQELYPPAADWPRLEPVAGKLLQQLEQCLRRRQAATQRVDCLLRHEHAPATAIRLGTARHERRSAVLLDLLARHFERTPLPAPITGIGIRCGDIQAVPPENLRLIDGGAAAEQHWPQLLDRLIARLGERQLSQPALRADHRPERANWKKVSGLFSVRSVRASENKPDTFYSMPPRPIWLLPRPARLVETEGRPEWNGPLALSPLPERIEQGWWDGHDARRDYYLARNPGGAQLWIYRDRDERSWYLHGIFS